MRELFRATHDRMANVRCPRDLSRQVREDAALQRRRTERELVTGAGAWKCGVEQAML
jgi:hypothetical protein